jgi:hypothetical protein
MGIMALADDLARIAAAAQREGDGMTGILAAELLDGSRVYLCSYESGAWLALGDDALPVGDRRAVQEAASLSALCEIAEELAGIEASEPRVATAEYLDRIGAGVGAGLEQALPSVQELAAQVIARHVTSLA